MAMLGPGDKGTGTSVNKPKPKVTVVKKDPNKKDPNKKTYTTTDPGGSSKSTSTSSSSGSGIKKSNDKPMATALKKMISTYFAKSRDIKIANINKVLDATTKDLLKGYGERAGQLEGSRKDNQKSEAAGSFENLQNRMRELADIREQAALQGAGESDTFKTQMMALRNWSANQSDVNRSFHDTSRSINSAITDLNADTRTAQTNAYIQANNDKEQTWADYYNQQQDAYTQLGNVNANPYSNQYGKHKTAYGNAAKTAGKAWKNPGVPKEVQNWKGSSQAVEERLNNSSTQARVTNLAQPKPEGATLREW